MCDIFDIERTEDLPERVVGYIKPNNRHGYYSTRALKLLKSANRPVSTQQMVAAFYREYNEQINLNRCASILNNLLRSGKISRDYGEKKWYI